MQVQYRSGVYLPGPGVWLDPHTPREVAVVSHAHADHVQRHRHVFATAATAAMMRLRGVAGCRFRTLAFGDPVETGQARITLFPAGHILGSAQTLVEWEGVRLLYSGDFKLRPGRCAEQIEVPHADILVMETTFGRPRYRFPPTERTVAEIADFCRATLESGCAPVLFCYSLGKGQEVLACLGELDCPIYLHAAHWEMTQLYRDLGVSLPPCRKFQPGQRVDGVLLCSSASRKAAWFQRLAGIRTAYISGWAIDAGAAGRSGADASFPLSDHADYDELWEYVRRTGAQSIYTMHGFAEEFAADLRRGGLPAEPLREAGPQLSLF